MADAPIFTKEDNERNEAAVHATVAKLETIARDHGLGAAISEAIGMSWGIAHVFKTLGLKHVHKQMRKDLADFLGKSP